MIQSRCSIDTPLGRYALVASDRGLTHTLPEDSGKLPVRAGRGDRAAARILDAARAAFAAYFAGDGSLLDRLSLDAAGTRFQQRVWLALREIPFGVTESYGGLARRLGQPRAARAVGLAGRSNPLAIVVPCHRLTGADGSLTGYAGGLERKRWLLDHEASAQASPSRRASPASPTALARRRSRAATSI